MSDLIKREDAIAYIDRVTNSGLGRKKSLDYIHKYISALPSADAKGANLINRHDATTVIREECWKCNKLINADLLGRILALPTSRQTDCTEFIMWLIEVILDDEDWELNAVGYGEIIARKMAKFGLLEVLDGYYIRTPNKPQSVVAEIKIDTDEIIKRLSELPSAEAVPQLRQTDTLIIADALRYLAQDTERHLVDRTRADALRQQFLKYGASMCKGGDDE